ncbi:MAG: 4-hydroxy-3-methylbut-2-enyl diphosphate reductase [Deltaproteobacteria bacterium]|nr:4-hydroxy-3-methylbut-2-enyl diphosphate reductase [Deltaproteobacteria bacterium]
MEIKIAASAGFCFGVKRAVKLAVEAAAKYPDQQIFTLGPIIHNPQVVARLADQGIRQLDNLEEIPPGIIIIRSHGVTRQVLAKLQGQAGVTIIDATCPFVRRAQKIVAQMAAENYRIIIVGEHNHPEVTALLSYGRPEATRAIPGPEEVAALLADGRKSGKTALLAQTTQSYENYAAVANRLLPLKGECRCFNTICDATSDRQEESRRIAADSDCMIIIGGYDSANTTRLYQLCREILPASHHIETPGQLRREWFQGCRRVGVTAGASTPKWLIDEVAARISRLADNR